MGRGRLEAFSDGVIAILITIMVLELKVPHEPSLSALREIGPVFCAYLLSFVFVGIYWNNHHHMLHATTHVNGSVLWANLHLLFWLSLIPFATAWMGETHLAPVPTALYGLVLWLAALAYHILQRTIIASQGPDSLLKRAVANDVKGLGSLAFYTIAVPTALVAPWVAGAIYVIVAGWWLLPDRRIEGLTTTGAGKAAEETKAHTGRP
jgi:TMEM175 potassium channel family protein